MSRVAVVGAGIAGSAVALALCKRGWRVDLFEAAQPAHAASGNWVGAFHPHVTRGDSPLSQLSRLGFEATLKALEELTQQGLLMRGQDWDTPGHLLTIPSAEAERARETLHLLQRPADEVQWSEPGQHLPSPHAGYFFPNGGWVKPPRWVAANLQACGEHLTLHTQHPVNALDELAGYDAVVVACAQHSLDLAPVPGAATGVVKGQITRHALQNGQRLPHVLSGETYAISPPADDWMLLGATYERPVLNMACSDEADADNLARFKAALPGWPLGGRLDQRTALRFVWHDRLPAVGPVPGLSNVYLSTGFASRGLLWAALAGELVADWVEKTPPENPLLRRLTPRARLKF
ncbi:MAG TPA: FAD-dependent 5-carboxymethylaminomethyl-2-thiouridine(34) oxidoreductase MnmC [Limnobacter sp.]